MSVESRVPGPPADFGTRFSAFMVDAALLGSLLWLAFFVLSRQLQAVGLTDTEPCSANPERLCEGPSTAVWVILIFVFVVLIVGYHALFEGLVGATPGKRLMALTVAGVDGVDPIGLTRGIERSVIRQLFWLSFLLVFEVSPFSLPVGAALFVIIPALPLAGLLLGAVAPSGRALHDLAAATVVVHTQARAPSPSVGSDLLSEDVP